MDISAIVSIYVIGAVVATIWAAVEYDNDFFAKVSLAGAVLTVLAWPISFIVYLLVGFVRICMYGSKS